jgi:hypothetical protein
MATFRVGKDDLSKMSNNDVVWFAPSPEGAESRPHVCGPFNQTRITYERWACAVCDKPLEPEKEVER